jgi:RNA polymerase sigma-70 factor (ECF subfamily)
MANQESGRDEALISQARAGDQQALAELLGKYRKRLRRMVSLRLDRRFHGRIDASDVLQKAFLDI